MATVAQQIRDRLGQDPTYVSLSPGGVYDRDLKRNLSTDPANPTKGATPDAWEALPPFRVRPATVVRDRGHGRSPGGPRGSYLSQPQLLFYAWPTESGKTRLAAMHRQAESLLIEFALNLDGGGTGLIEDIPDRFGVLDDDEFGAVYDSAPVEIHGIRRHVL